ncbi:MAG: hypothetical protein ABIJ56_16765 [Pseudomonadota bacterium]
MKRVFNIKVFFFFAAAALMGPAPHEPEPAENFLANADMESSKGADAAPWYRVGLFPGVRFDVDREAERSGNASLKTQVTDIDIVKKYGPPNWAQDITANIPAGETATLRVRIRTEDVEGFAAAAVQCWQGETIIGFGTTQHVRMLGGTTGWTPLSVGFVVPPETEKMRVLLMLSGTGAAWFDDAVLQRGGEVTAIPGIGAIPAGAVAGAVVGCLGALFGILAGILGFLAAKDRKKYHGMLLFVLGLCTIMGAAALAVGIYAYAAGALLPVRYPIALGGVIFFGVGGINFMVQRRPRLRIDRLKEKLSKLE